MTDEAPGEVTPITHPIDDGSWLDPKRPGITYLDPAKPEDKDKIAKLEAEAAASKARLAGGAPPGKAE